MIRRFTTTSLILLFSLASSASAPTDEATRKPQESTPETEESPSPDPGDRAKSNYTEPDTGFNSEPYATPYNNSFTD